MLNSGEYLSVNLWVGTSVVVPGSDRTEMLPLGIGGDDIMLGINDPWIWGVYILCILSTLLCVAYGLANWNNGIEPGREQVEIREELEWEDQEEQMQKEELGL
jgi:hypothetical protein